MRHIPEDELHAYLDQALSRSQCVEIERHLAGCPRCALLRDDIAGLRDRTTSILAHLGPPPILAPPLATLYARHEATRATRRRLVVRGIWAASLTGAVLLGTQVHRWLGQHPGQVAVAAATAARPALPAASPGVAVRTPAEPGATTQSVSRPEGRRGPERLLRVRERPTDEEVGPTLASAGEARPLVLFPTEPVFAAAALPGREFAELATQPVSDDPGLRGLWRVVAPDSGALAVGGEVPRVPGLPVTQVRVQPGQGAGDVTAVDQLLETGELIRTIAGPAGRVLALVAADDRAAVSGGGTTPESDRTTVTIRQGDRMLAVTGPSQALGSLLARVNSRRRY